MNEETKDFWGKFRLPTFDRILFFCVILSHIIISIEAVKHEIGLFLSHEWALIIYVLLTTLFWSIYVYRFSEGQVKRHEQEVKSKLESFSKEKEILSVEITRAADQVGILSTLLNKSKGYIGAYEDIGLGFSMVHQIQRNITLATPGSPNFDDQIAIILNQFGQVCTHVAEGFKRITGVPDISVCIKLINYSRRKNGKFKNITSASTVRTLIRDMHSVDRCYEEKEGMHTIQGNTAFSSILDGMSSGMIGRTFASNDLALWPYYKNSSFGVYKQEPWRDNLSSEEKQARWKLPYRSTIIAAIYPNQQIHNAVQPLIGFLCIDSGRPDAFSIDEDTLILTGVADGIYNTLSAFNKLTQ